jgi:hypothetical protein
MRLGGFAAALGAVENNEFAGEVLHVGEYNDLQARKNRWAKRELFSHRYGTDEHR